MVHIRESRQTQSHEFYLDLARRAPKVDQNDKRVRAYVQAKERGEKDPRGGSHEQFGNNFFMLFLERQRKERDPDNQMGHLMVYIPRAEALGDKWQRFVSQNTGLLHQIDAALNTNFQWYGQLFDHFLELTRAGRWDQADELEAATGHPLGIEAVGIWTWDKINPLLKKASDAMNKCGINAREFYG